MDVHTPPKTAQHTESLTNLIAWNALRQHAQDIAPEHMKDWFAQDPQRAQRFSCQAAGLHLDYSKNRIQNNTLALLLALAQERHVQKKVHALFRGDLVNTTEQMPALHPALRLPPQAEYYWGGRHVAQEVENEREKMTDFIEHLESGQWKGSTGKPFTDVINIGIGGSDLGARMLHKALEPYHQSRLNVHFVANIDAADLQQVCATLDPETTCLVIASKSFKTTETLYNARTAITWLSQHLPNVTPHLIGISACPQRMDALGIPRTQQLTIWPWVGGRYSIWSAMGFCVALAIGMQHFRSFLEGGFQMDRHVQIASPEQNMPMLLALLEIWYTNFFHCHSMAVLPYAQQLSELPATLQQLAMESNGKSMTHAGKRVSYATTPVLWGHVGCNGQHAFHQMLHQGPQMVPVDIIVSANSDYKPRGHHDWLLANALSQAQALMQGHQTTAPHEQVPGNRPSNMIILPDITPESMGALLALYEHKVFIQSVIWDINAFDQYGVELGKKLGHRVLPALKTGQLDPSLDSSTQALVRTLRALKEKR